MKTVKDILTAYIKQVGGDGLVHLDYECSCPIEDLQLCDSWMMECVPARKEKCTYQNGLCIECDGDEEYGDGFHYIAIEKEANNV